MSTMDAADIQPEYGVLDELMGFSRSPNSQCSMCCFPITKDRPLHYDTGVCRNCFNQVNDGDFLLDGYVSPSNQTNSTSCCVLCKNDIAEDCKRYVNSNLCVECVHTLRDGNYEMTLKDDDGVDGEDNDKKGEVTPQTPVIKSNLSTPIRDTESFIDQIHENVKQNYKEALLASLYSQVEFLRNQVEEVNSTNRNLIKYILSMSGINVDAAISQMHTPGIRSETTPTHESTQSSSDDESETGSTVSVFEEYIAGNVQMESQETQNPQQPRQPQQLNEQQQQKQQLHQQLQQRKGTEDQLNDYVKKKHAAYIADKERPASCDDDDDIAPWEQHSNKFGSKLMSKWGYAGGGLGKDGKGITSPIKASPHVAEANDRPWPKNTTLIIGDSMLNGIEEERLKRYNAKVYACSGASIKDIYSKITPLLAKKPNKVILHVGTNDSPFKPSDWIVNELCLLRKFIENHLPGGTVIISSPITRTDNKLANSRIREINTSMESLPNVIINNKIDAFCLGRKGLHLNRKGSGKLAVGFISEMQRV